MVGLRKFLSTLNLLALWLFIGAFGIFFILSQILKPIVIKNWISSDNGYQNITSAIKHNLTISSDGASDETVAKALSAITPDVVQRETEVAIDKYFSYMKGDKTAMTLSSAEINDQIFKAINVGSAELPSDARQMIPDFQLPVVSDSNFESVNHFYRWIFVDQPYILGIIGLLLLSMIFLRFNFRDRTVWLFWSVFVPFIGVAISFLTLTIVKNYLLKTDSLFSDLSADVKEIVYHKIKSLFSLVYSVELQTFLVELTVVIVFFILYLLAHYLGKQGNDLVKETPALPSPVSASTNK